MRITSMEEYHDAYRRSVDDPETFWSSVAAQFKWRKKFHTTLEWDFSEFSVKWFNGGMLNITENCIDRHLDRKKNDIAFIWEPNEPGDAAKQISYGQLYQEVCRVANALKQHGIGKGDRVCIYMPMIPETVYAMLACARIGAVHSVVFGGFSASSLADRINDSGCKMLLTADETTRGSKLIRLGDIAREAVERCSSIEKVIIHRRKTDNSENEIPGWLDWRSEVSAQAPHCEAVSCGSEDPLFILYTSGSTGKPKGVVHTCGGYMVYAAYTFVNVFQYNEQDLYWCTADVGWITGHSYMVYGPLLAGASSVLFEGVLNYPTCSRYWQVVDKHRVNVLYTAPTAIRALMAAGDEFVMPFRLSSLKVLGSVGEPINEEAWHWYHEKVGRGRCPIVDTWWQTETGGILISALASISPTKPGSAGLPLPGIQPVVMDEKGRETSGAAEGNLCIRFPWPGMLRTTWGDHERCRKNYFESYPGYYFTGDGCRRDEQGMYRITGRVDDVLNVSGHRIGTAEVENAINEHPDIVESAVVGYPHDIKGQGICAFCISTHTGKPHDQLRQEISDTVARELSAIARPDKIQIVGNLPKTRSGKIMRRILRKIAEGNSADLGDTSTLLDPEIVNDIIRGRQ